MLMKMHDFALPSASGARAVAGAASASPAAPAAAVRRKSRRVGVTSDMTRSGEGWGGEVAPSYRTVSEMQQAERTLLLLEYVTQEAQHRLAALDHLRADLLVLPRAGL